MYFSLKEVVVKKKIFVDCGMFTIFYFPFPVSSKQWNMKLQHMLKPRSIDGIIPDLSYPVLLNMDESYPIDSFDTEFSYKEAYQVPDEVKQYALHIVDINEQEGNSNSKTLHNVQFYC